MKRILFVGLGLAAVMASLPALAGPRDDVLYGITRCGAISDDRTWLDCVYGAAQPMRAQLGLSPAPATQQKLVPPAQSGVTANAALAQAYAPPAEKPGFLMRMMTPKHEAPETPTTLKSYKFDAAGYFTVSLANGESWQQDLGDTARARWNKAAGNYAVQILPTASTYYYLKVGGQQYMVNKQ